MPSATIREDGAERTVTGRGTGPIDAFVDAPGRHWGVGIHPDIGSASLRAVTSAANQVRARARVGAAEASA